MIKNIYVFSNCGKLSQLPKSGGQTSARRVMKGLEDSGFKIIPIRRHRNELEGKLLHIIETLSFALIDSCKIFFKLLCGRRKNSAFMHLTYAGPLVPYELWLTTLARLLGYQCIEYLKGGQVVDFYEHGNKLHKWMFKKNMDMQSIAFFEGIESLEIAKKVTNTQLVHFPNYCFDEIIPKNIESKPTNQINLLYFGRIAPNKNIHIIMETFELLCKKHDNIYLTLIGGVGQSKTYAEYIDCQIANSKHKDHIIRMGNTPFSTIKEIMKFQHFFIFPSKEQCEGHSNSLNEAMAMGVIPIVSDYHFNRSIVADDRFVVVGYDAIAYSNKIEDLINNYDLQELSLQVWKHVSCNYTYSIVNSKIVKHLKKI